MSTLDKTAKQWLAARNIIAEALGEINGKGGVTEREERNAAAIIARLANADPPLLICTADELKD